MKKFLFANKLCHQLVYMDSEYIFTAKERRFYFVRAFAAVIESGCQL